MGCNTMGFMIYEPKEKDLLIQLHDDGYIGQRLYNEYNKTFPNRHSYRSVLNKIQSLRNNKTINR